MHVYSIWLMYHALSFEPTRKRQHLFHLNRMTAMQGVSKPLSQATNNQRTSLSMTQALQEENALSRLQRGTHLSMMGTLRLPMNSPSRKTSEILAEALKITEDLFDDDSDMEDNQDIF